MRVRRTLTFCLFAKTNRCIFVKVSCPSLTPRTSRMAEKRLVDASHIAYASLHKEKPTWARFDVFPFALLDLVFFYLYFLKYDEYIGAQEITFLCLVGLLGGQALVWLAGEWDLRVRAAIAWRSVLVSLERNMKARRLNHGAIG